MTVLCKRCGPHHPDAITFDPSHRPYVRQEYAAWTAAGRR
ncbi:hypothetical protein BX281_2498 [Streptomyces sp. Ag82_O1-15]|nr:hypothetical protein BX281_2498 [Streptomyces sp. Ag82_O1-15]